MEELLGTIGFDWRVAIANLISFLVIFLLLRQFAWGPIKRVIAKRRKEIDEGLEKAQLAETERIMAAEKAKETIASAKTEANTIVTSANERGNEIIASAEVKAGERADDIIAKASRDIERAREEMSDELKKESATLVAGSIGKILREDIDAGKNADIVKRALTHMK